MRATNEPDPMTDIIRRELRPVLDEELQALPEKYRAPLVLCYLQGKTQNEAARLLGVSKATVKNRLERGKELLRARLVRRGLGPGAILLTAAGLTVTARASVPSALLLATARNALASRAGTLLSMSVALLSRRVLRSMLLARFGAVVALAVCLVPVAGSVLLMRSPSAPVEVASHIAGRGTSAPSPRPATVEGNAAGTIDGDFLHGTWQRMDVRESERAVLSFGPSKQLVICWTPPAQPA